MAVFQIAIGLLIAGAVLIRVARLVGVPGPAFLALAGAALAMLPGAPSVTLDPDLALVLLVAPLLLDASYDTSLRDLLANWVPVTVLAINLVVLTAAAVAVVAHWLLPAMPWSAAVALGAIVAPPDAAAATSVLRRLSPPHRIMVILEGESLLNDASALLLFRLAVAIGAGQVSLAHAAPVAAFSTLAGGLLGFVLAQIFVRMQARVSEGAASVVLQFVATFGVWMLAEWLDVSAILTVVAYGMTLGRLSPRWLLAHDRLASHAVWAVAVYALTVLAFLLTGLQVRTVLAEAGANWPAYLVFAAWICLTVIVVRLLYAWLWTAILVLKNRLFGAAVRRAGWQSPTLRGGLVVGWCGMRGVVTLATALALPKSFPGHGLIVFTAFAVVLVTLVVQGFTIGPLLGLLRLENDGSVEHETALARAETARAALLAIGPEIGAAATALRADYEARLHQAIDPAAAGIGASELASLRQRLVAVERQVLYQMRADNRIGDDAFRTVEGELDWQEVNAARRLGTLG